MKKLLSFTFILLLCTNILSSQSCLPEGIEFTMQEQIDNFQTDYPGCKEIEGYVNIIGNDITDLSGLSVVNSIGIALDIHSAGSLTSLTGLENLTSVGHINIGENPLLTNLTGLEGLDSIGGGMIIQLNPTLASLEGLNNLSFVGDNLWIYNDALTSLNSLESLTSIGGSLRIISNGGLTSMTGLDNLSSIGGELFVDGNISLNSFTGLENLTSVGDRLYISNNHSLVSLVGLDNINEGSISDMVISGNPSLSNCKVKSICDFLVSPNGTIYIQGNATGCNSQEEVAAACGIGLDEETVVNQFSIFPNPTSTHITISTPTTPNKNTLLTIFIINGQQLLKRQITEKQTVVDVSWLPQGVYIVKVSDDRTVQVGKLMKDW